MFDTDALRKLVNDWNKKYNWVADQHLIQVGSGHSSEDAVIKLSEILWNKAGYRIAMVGLRFPKQGDLLGTESVDSRYDGEFYEQISKTVGAYGCWYVMHGHPEYEYAQKAFALAPT